ncbi:hypothetical protein ID854_11675 [Xenorhabdus sp. M]|uniref:Pertussis toxin subunit 1 n=1 Tax=Xenorhabdus szentirmaii TaxID=290112 RepID=A0AAW3YSJ9_9GAMM|nr:hypothetical protein [Xenorhabdus sp. M]MBD2801095.1 hypothetical protein [Xenorhabdus sp. M]
MKIVKLLTLLFVLFLYATQSLAVVFFYRVDYRPFTRISANNPPGFNAWGTNDDLLRHVEGASLGGSNPTSPASEQSAFISTTSDLNQAISLGETITISGIEGLGRLPFYIYEIRPTDNFYSVERSFRYYEQQTGDTEIYNQMLAAFGDQREYAAYLHIPIAQIHRVIRYDYNAERNRYEVAQTVDNEDYVDAPTGPNPGPYPRIPASGPAAYLPPDILCTISLNNSSSMSRFFTRSLSEPVDYVTTMKNRKRCHIMMEEMSSISDLLLD